MTEGPTEGTVRLRKQHEAWVLDVLVNGPATQGIIYNKSGLMKAQTAWALRRLERKKIVRKVGPVWELTDSFKQTDEFRELVKRNMGG